MPRMTQQMFYFQLLMTASENNKYHSPTLSHRDRFKRLFHHIFNEILILSKTLVQFFIAVVRQ